MLCWQQNRIRAQKLFLPSDLIILPYACEFSFFISLVWTAEEFALLLLINSAYMRLVL